MCLIPFLRKRRRFPPLPRLSPPPPRPPPPTSAGSAASRPWAPGGPTVDGEQSGALRKSNHCGVVFPFIRIWLRPPALRRRGPGTNPPRSQRGGDSGRLKDRSGLICRGLTEDDRVRVRVGLHSYVCVTDTHTWRNQEHPLDLMSLFLGLWEETPEQTWRTRVLKRPGLERKSKVSCPRGRKRSLTCGRANMQGQTWGCVHVFPDVDNNNNNCCNTVRLNNQLSSASHQPTKETTTLTLRKHQLLARC